MALKDGKKTLADLASGKILMQPFRLGRTKLTSINNFMTFGILNGVCLLLFFGLSILLFIWVPYGSHVGPVGPLGFTIVQAL